MGQKKGMHVEIIANMYDLGFFKRSLKSRKRLRITALATVLGLCGCYFAVGHFIRYQSQIWGVNILLTLALYIFVLVAAYLVALCIGDIFYIGPWREKMRCGSQFEPEKIEDQQALLKNRSIYFVLFWGLSIVALNFGCDFATGGNMRWYHSVGGILISMRSNDVRERENVLKTLSNVYHDKKWQHPEIRAMIVKMIRDPEVRVRALASYITGKAKIAEGADDLTMLLKGDGGEDAAMAEAAIALGRLEWKPARALLLSVLRQSFRTSHKNTQLSVAILYAFYEMKDGMLGREAVEMMSSCLEDGDCSDEVMQYGFFYLKSLRIKESRALSFRYLESPKATLPMQCYAADILRFTAERKDADKMKQRFEQTPMNAQCREIFRKYHQEAAVVLYDANTLRGLFVRAIGNLKNPKDYDWIWMVGANSAENLQTRKVAETYARALQEK